ncbi:MAG: hypothetical protein L0323_20015 [Planctomycetes bacterium]|nr:hypothetical protein [Planctomycetota bacterium]
MAAPRAPDGRPVVGVFEVEEGIEQEPAREARANRLAVGVVKPRAELVVEAGEPSPREGPAQVEIEEEQRLEAVLGREDQVALDEGLIDGGEKIAVPRLSALTSRRSRAEMLTLRPRNSVSKASPARGVRCSRDDSPASSAGARHGQQSNPATRARRLSRTSCPTATTLQKAGRRSNQAREAPFGGKEEGGMTGKKGKRATEHDRARQERRSCSDRGHCQRDGGGEDA